MPPLLDPAHTRPRASQATAPTVSGVDAGESPWCSGTTPGGGWPASCGGSSLLHQLRLTARPLAPLLLRGSVHLAGAPVRVGRAGAAVEGVALLQLLAPLLGVLANHVAVALPGGQRRLRHVVGAQLLRGRHSEAASLRELVCALAYQADGPHAAELFDESELVAFVDEAVGGLDGVVDARDGADAAVGAVAQRHAGLALHQPLLGQAAALGGVGEGRGLQHADGDGHRLLHSARALQRGVAGGLEEGADGRVMGGVQVAGAGVDGDEDEAAVIGGTVGLGAGLGGEGRRWRGRGVGVTLKGGGGGGEGDGGGGRGRGGG